MRVEMKTLVSGSDEELKYLADEGLNRVLPIPLFGFSAGPKEIIFRIRVVENLIDEGKYLEALCDTCLVLIMASGATEEDIDSYKRTAFEAGERVAQTVGDKVASIDSERIKLVSAYALLSTYMWSLIDYGIEFSVSFSEFLLTNPQLEQEVVDKVTNIVSE